MLHTFGQPEATCGKTLVGVGQGLKMVKFLLQHFRMLQDAARVLPTPSQHLLTRSNNVARRSVEMLPVFGRAFTMLPGCY